MTTTKIPLPLNDDGTYLFKSPKNVTLTINKELAVVFLVSQPACFGVIRFDPARPQAELETHLNSLWMQIQRKVQGASSNVELKAFGLSEMDKPTVTHLLSWCRLKKLTLSAQDLGRKTTRTILIDGALGRIGVSYATERVAGPSHFLTVGSARDRLAHDAKTELCFLLLTESLVTATLARQSIEQTDSWSASVALRATRMMQNLKVERFPWNVILLFEDVGRSRYRDAWVKKILKTAPLTLFVWVGTHAPSALDHWPVLPLPRPENMEVFKASVANLLSQDAALETVVAFPKKKRRAR